METSRFEESVTVSPDPRPDEAAAIAAAIARYLEGETASIPEATEGLPPWAIAGRLERLTGEGVRRPEELPANPWTHARRIDR